MMMNLSCEVIQRLKGRTLVTAESCTGGAIGAALTAVAGSSTVYKGGIISYRNEVKASILQVGHDVLSREGAVSSAVAEAMACGARSTLGADIAVSVTGLAGPGGDDHGNPVGTVFVGYSDDKHTFCVPFLFSGDRQQIREKAVKAALEIVLEQNK